MCATYPGIASTVWDMDARTFFLLARKIPEIYALQRVHWTRAVMIGAGMVWSGKDWRREAERDLREAFGG